MDPRAAQLIELIQRKQAEGINRRPVQNMIPPIDPISPAPYADPHGGPETPMTDATPTQFDSMMDKYGGRSPDVQNLFKDAAAKNAGGVAHAAEAAAPVDGVAAKQATIDARNSRIDKKVAQGAEYEKGQAAAGSKQQFLDALQARQNFDENMHISPSLVSVASWGNPSQMIEVGGSGPPNASRQKQIDDMRLEGRESAKNTADIEAARVKNESAAQSLGRMASTDINEISDLETAMVDLEDIEKGLTKHAGDVGPFDARMGKVQELGGYNAEGAAYRSGIMDFMLKFRKATSGVSFGKQEAKDIQSAIIHPQDKEEIIAAKIPRLKKALARAREIKIANQGRAGKDTSGFSAGATDAGGGEATTTFTGPDGKTVDVPNTDTEAQQRLRAAGWK